MESPQAVTSELAHSPLPASSIWTVLVVVTVSLGFVMAMLDVTVVNVALGDIQGEFHAPLSQLVWTIDAYTLTYAALLLLGGALADRVGAKRAYMIGLVWFVAASALCGWAHSADMLIRARLLQGVGAALFVPSSLSLLTESFPDRATRTRLLGIWGAIIAAAAGSGPLVGGVLISLLGWRSIFYVNLPIGLGGIVLAAVVLKQSPRKVRRFDLSTHAMLMIALAGLSFTLIEGPSLGWLSFHILVGALVATLALAGVVFRERTSTYPVIPRPLSANSHFWAFNALGFLVNFILFGEIFVVSLFLPKALGNTAFASGLKMLPMMCMLSIMNVASGFLAVRIGVRNVILCGFAVAGTGAITATLVDGQTEFWALASAVALCNAGIGLAVPAIINGLMQEAGATYSNIGAASLNANRQIGALAGVAAVGIVLHRASDWSLSMRVVFAGFAFCAFLALTLFQSAVRRSDTTKV